MTDEAITVGQDVRLPERHQRGTVREVDRSLFVARVALNRGGEVWARWDELEVIPRWQTLRTEHGSIA